MFRYWLNFCCAIILCSDCSIRSRSCIYTANIMDNRLDLRSLDKLFKPSCWSKRYSTPEQVMSEHIAATKNGKHVCFSHFCLRHPIDTYMFIDNCIGKYSDVCAFCTHYYWLLLHAMFGHLQNFHVWLCILRNANAVAKT